MIVALVAGLVAVDGLVRLVETRASGNLAHIAELPRILGEARKSDKPALLLLGNSLTNNGTEQSAIQAGLPMVSVAKVTPDATGLWDWQCILRHQVLADGPGAIKYVIIGTAWHLLSDEAAVDPSRLGALFCQLSDLSSPAAIGLNGSSDIGEFLLAYISRTYALRDTLRNRLFKIAIPHYERYAGEDNAQPAGDPGMPNQAPSYTYARLELLANQLREHGVKLVVLLMPIPKPYEIDRGLRHLADRGLLILRDYRAMPGITRESFIDSMHLGADGRAILSARLSSDLVGIVAANP